MDGWTDGEDAEVQISGYTYKGQPEGKVGEKGCPSHASLAWGPETPPSPDANRTDVPRAPSWAYALHRVLVG